MRDRLGRPMPEHPAMREALRMASLPSRKPTEADCPPLSRFPLTRAAKAALRLSKHHNAAG